MGNYQSTNNNEDIRHIDPRFKFIVVTLLFILIAAILITPTHNTVTSQPILVSKISYVNFGTVHSAKGFGYEIDVVVELSLWNRGLVSKWVYSDDFLIDIFVSFNGLNVEWDIVNSAEYSDVMIKLEPGKTEMSVPFSMYFTFLTDRNNAPSGDYVFTTHLCPLNIPLKELCFGETIENINAYMEVFRGSNTITYDQGGPNLDNYRWLYVSWVHIELLIFIILSAITIRLLVFKNPVHLYPKQNLID